MTFQGSERDSRDDLRSPQTVRDVPDTGGALSSGVPRSEHYIYCHGTLKRVTLTSEGWACSCCGTLIRWYVW